jgi:aminobenzoyl-glutamate transport protein
MVKTTDARAGWLGRLEAAGDALPDPAALFLGFFGLVVALSAGLAPVDFGLLDPRNGEALRVVDLTAGPAAAKFIADATTTFTGFRPLGLVIVVMLGVGVADRAGLIQAALRGILRGVPVWALSPAVLFAGILSHVSGDAGFVLVVPVAGRLFRAAGRHPVAGIAAAFAGVSGGFSASLLPSALDPLLAGITAQAGQIVAPALEVNPMCNLWFTMSASVLVVGLGWLLTDRFVEPGLSALVVDGAPPDGSADVLPGEGRGLGVAAAVFVGLAVGLVAVAGPASSALRDPSGSLWGPQAPLMASLVPLITLGFFGPGLAFGIVTGRIRSHRDVVDGMRRGVEGLSGYLVMAFFAAQFVEAFSRSNLGALVSVEGASALAAARVPVPVTLVGLVLLSAGVDLLIGSASAKWAMMGPVLVPMLMQVGVSPELTQAAYRVGDSTANIVTPLMPYFPLVLGYARSHASSVGTGTLIGRMIPYSLVYLVAWTAWLLLFWGLGWPLGLGGGLTWPR